MGSKGIVTNCFGELIKVIWSRPLNGNVINLQSFIDTIRPIKSHVVFKEIRKEFGSGTQEDVQEFLLFLLDIFHEDLNRVLVKQQTEEKEEDGVNELEEEASECWKLHLLRNKSIIIDLFNGQLKSTLVCSSCKEVTEKFEPFMYLALPVFEDKDPKKKEELDECLKEFSKEEQLKNEDRWTCSKCKKVAELTKKIELWKLPNILVIHLKRFVYTKSKHGKINSYVNFPIKNLNLHKYVCSKEKENPLEDLFAIVNHSGTLELGHETSFAKSRITHQWYLFNDDQIILVDDLEKLINPEAYLLLYFKKTVTEFRRQAEDKPEFWPHILQKEKQKKELASNLSDTERSAKKINKNKTIEIHISTPLKAEINGKLEKIERNVEKPEKVAEKEPKVGEKTETQSPDKFEKWNEKVAKFNEKIEEKINEKQPELKKEKSEKKKTKKTNKLFSSVVFKGPEILKKEEDAEDLVSSNLNQMQSNIEKELSINMSEKYKGVQNIISIMSQGQINSENK